MIVTSEMKTSVFLNNSSPIPNQHTIYISRQKKPQFLMVICHQSALPPPPLSPNALSSELSFGLGIDKLEFCQLFAHPGVPMKTWIVRGKGPLGLEVFHADETLVLLALNLRVPWSDVTSQRIHRLQSALAEAADQQSYGTIIGMGWKIIQMQFN